MCLVGCCCKYDANHSTEDDSYLDSCNLQWTAAVRIMRTTKRGTIGVFSVFWDEDYLDSCNAMDCCRQDLEKFLGQIVDCELRLSDCTVVPALFRCHLLEYCRVNPE